MGRGESTRRGKNVVVFPTDDVYLIFEKVTKKSVTKVTKPTPGTVPKPRQPRGFRVRQYYDIRTTAGISGKISIRIIYDSAAQLKKEERLQLWQQNKRWNNITKHFNRKYHLLIGETDHFSMFGVT